MKKASIVWVVAAVAAVAVAIAYFRLDRDPTMSGTAAVEASNGPNVRPDSPGNANDERNSNEFSAVGGHSPTEQSAASQPPIGKGNADSAALVGEPIRMQTSALQSLLDRPSTGEEGEGLKDYHHKVELEVRDASWSYPTEQDIKDAINGPTPTGSVTVERVDCRTSLCEVQISQPQNASPDALTDAMQMLQRAAPQKNLRVKQSATFVSLTDSTAAGIVILERTKTVP